MDRKFSYQESGSRNQATPIVIASRKHDMNAIQIYDRRDAELPNVGLLKVKDPETGARVWADTALVGVREAYAQAWRNQQQALDSLYTKTGIHNISVRTDEDYVKALMRLFKQ
jgi:uncharacterized protein (DUF58 family)